MNENIENTEKVESRESTEATESTENTENTQDTENTAAESVQEQTEEEKLNIELAETKDKYLRLMAEYDNYRKRTAKQMIEMSATVKGDTIAQLLPIYDNFERAANAESADETYKSGVEMIFGQLTEAIKKLGVEIIDPTGQPFDPNIANAVSQIEDPELGENTVAQTFQKGYKIGDRVIRYAMVVVANA